MYSSFQIAGLFSSMAVGKKVHEPLRLVVLGQYPLYFLPEGSFQAHLELVGRDLLRKSRGILE